MRQSEIRAWSGLPACATPAKEKPIYPPQTLTHTSHLPSDLLRTTRGDWENLEPFLAADMLEFQAFLLSSPLINPESIRAISSRSAFRA